MKRYVVAGRKGPAARDHRDAPGRRSPPRFPACRFAFLKVFWGPDLGNLVTSVTTRRQVFHLCTTVDFWGQKILCCRGLPCALQEVQVHPVFCPRGQRHPHSSTATAQNVSRRCQMSPGTCSSPAENRSLRRYYNMFLKINFIVSGHKTPVVTQRDDL